MTDGDDPGPISDVNEDIDVAIAALQEYGLPAIDGHLDRIAAKVLRGARAREGKVVDLMQACKHARGFRQMLEIAEIFGDMDDVRLVLLKCQARIDTGDYRGATRRLERLRAALGEQGDKTLISETLGLLGRAHKQMFVESHASGEEGRASEHLKWSFDFHRQARDLDLPWHGANLAALAWRAEKEGIELDDRASDIGAALLRDLGAPANPSPWIVAATAQAYMAQGDWISGKSRYEEYFLRLRKSKGRSVAFTLFGDIRQLREIWLAGTGEVPETAEIVAWLQDQIGATVFPASNSQELRTLLSSIETMSGDPMEELQAIVTSGEIITVDEMLRVIDNRHAVAKISDRLDQPRGTGFLLDGSRLGRPDRAVFLTNNHVIATDPNMAKQITPENANISFESWSTGKTSTFSIREVIAESPCRDHDITIALLDGLPDGATVATVRTPEEPFLKPQAEPGSLGRVHPIGHPDGGALSLSLAGNQVLDHDLYKSPRGVRRLHYKANTKEGNSGSPVFGRSGQVVAVHRAATKAKILGTPVRHRDDYAVNEGVGIGCIISWFQS